MTNPNTPQGQTPRDQNDRKTSGSDKPTGGQKTQPKYDEENQANDPNKRKSDDMNKAKKPDQH